MLYLRWHWLRILAALWACAVPAITLSVVPETNTGCAADAILAMHGAAFVQATIGPQRSPSAAHRFSETVDGWQPVVRGDEASTSSLAQLQSESSSPAAPAQNAGVPSLWGVLWFDTFGKANVAPGHKFEGVILFCAIAFITFIIMCLLRFSDGSHARNLPKGMDADWDAAFEKSLAASGLEPLPPCSFRDSPIPLSHSDPLLSPRAESFVSCQDPLTPRSVTSFADCEETQTLLLSRPASRMQHEVTTEEPQQGRVAGNYGSFW